MAQDTQLTAREGGEGEEEIIEKKPSAPTATVLMILTTVILGLAIYITGDEMSFYFNKKDYKQEKRAEHHYDRFRQEVRHPMLEDEPGSSDIERE